MELKWADINWEYSRMLVHSPKAEHHEAGDSRLVLLFPELAGVLSEVFEADADRSVFVVTRYRDSTQNLRTTFRKIIHRAGVQPWPKLFQNLRSTRETELAEMTSLQAVTAWMGNSQLVAARHYLQLTDEHLPLASGNQSHPSTNGPKVAHHVANKTCEITKTENPAKAETPGKTQCFSGGSM